MACPAIVSSGFAMARVFQLAIVTTSRWGVSGGAGGAGRREAAAGGECVA
jgi:hypothetical protein